MATNGAPGGTQGIVEALTSISNESLEGAPPPSQAFVDWLHGQASTTKPDDLHHTLGFQQNQAAIGNHRHNGKDSLTIIPPSDAFALTDLGPSPATSDIVAAVNKLNAMARTYLGSA